MEYIIGLAYLGVLLYASMTDARKLVVRNRVHVMIILLALFHYQSLLQNVAGAVLLTLPFLVYAVKTNHLGGGDVKFIFANVVYLGCKESYMGIVVGLICIILVYYVENRRFTDKKIPFIPFLSLGYSIVFIVSQL